MEPPPTLQRKYFITKSLYMASEAYDHIAQDYKSSKELPFRTYVETHTLFQIAGPIDGLNVIDLACGEGFYTRKLKKAGARSVTGVDVSQEMIRLAELNEQESPLGCRYYLCDVAQMPELGSFDLMVAMYLLNYAGTKAELLAFCRAAYRQLAAGGRFIGVNDNPGNDPDQYLTYRPYGFTKQVAADRKEGDAIQYTFFKEDGSHFQFNNYYLHPQTYLSAFEEAGFVNFQWMPLSLAPSQQENPFWDHFLAEPPIIGFSAEKV